MSGTSAKESLFEKSQRSDLRFLFYFTVKVSKRTNFTFASIAFL